MAPERDGQRRVAAAFMIPFILLAGPAAGAWLGSRLDGRFGTAAGLVLGLAAAVIRVRQIIKGM